MKERPILFNSDMVRAILDGRKTQTRRVVKLPRGYVWEPDGNGYANIGGTEDIIPCPYGQPGDRIWVRETWMPDPSCDDDAWDDAAISYHEWDGCGMPMRDYPEALKSASNVIYRASWDGQEMVGWKPSIHMPRWASRITLEIVSVRVERLNEISADDCVAEGCGAETWWPETNSRAQFQRLWESINGSESWQANPWVWCVSFRRVE